MEKQRELNVLSIIALLIAIIGLTVAFAALSTTLTINGQATVKSGTWEVKFENLSDAIISGSASIDEQNKPYITENNGINNTKISKYSVTLTKPGDSVSYTFDVHNSGSIDAKIGTFSMNKPQCKSLASDPVEEDATMVCNNLVYTLQYAEDGNANVSANDVLDNKQVKKMKLTVGYDINAKQIPSNEVEITIPDISIIYVQK